MITDFRFGMKQMARSSALRFLKVMTLAGCATLVDPVQAYVRSNSYD